MKSSHPFQLIASCFHICICHLRLSSIHLSSICPSKTRKHSETCRKHCITESVFFQARLYLQQCKQSPFRVSRDLKHTKFFNCVSIKRMMSKYQFRRTKYC